ncbi:alpha/beta fold hydrolase [Haloferula sargassicola]|uniref:2-succinyl-6-hydroxy-2, 4-cyclohexadiene-1-carboxylate synthase n=1 Tax=Haloferula sargassicola TaxID=490096 RepID=A0ABP9UNI9_9BACT
MLGTIWCLHGAVGMAEDWRGFAVPGWAVKRVDLWRFLDCCPMPLEAFGKALNEEAAAVSGRKVLLGYSMGGRLALHALLAGGPWQAAVIVSAHPGLEDAGERSARLARDAEWAAAALKGEWRDFLSRWNAQPVLGGDAALPDRMKLEPRRNPVARSFMDWSLGAQEPLGERLGEIRCPVLWVAGERDGKFRALAERAAGPEKWIAPGAGHRVPWESPEFPGIVGEFLERSVS